MATPPTITQAPPRREQRPLDTLETSLRMTYEEFLAWAGEDVHAEWEDGEVIVFTPPKPRHQDITGFLHTLLRLFVQFFKIGKVLAAPLEMKVDPNSPAREPDLLFVATENLARLTENKLEGPADLIVEIISDDSVSRDRSRKFYEYQAAGVREYWIIDPRPGTERADTSTGLSASFWVLDADGRYRPVTVGDDGTYHSTILPGFWLRVDWLWEEELPDPQLTFAEIAGFPPQVVEALQEIAARGPRTTPDTPSEPQG